MQYRSYEGNISLRYTYRQKSQCCLKRNHYSTPRFRHDGHTSAVNIVLHKHCQSEGKQTELQPPLHGWGSGTSLFSSQWGLQRHVWQHRTIHQSQHTRNKLSHEFTRKLCVNTQRTLFTLTVFGNRFFCFVFDYHGCLFCHFTNVWRGGRER